MKNDRSERASQISRRRFLSKTGRLALGLSSVPLIFCSPKAFARGPEEPAEKLVHRLRLTLSDEQKRKLILPWNDGRRLRVDNNWRVVPYRIGRIFSSEQQEYVRQILQAVTSEDGFQKIMRAMKDDSGGIRNYSACLFSDGSDKLSFMLTGRHQTIRADGGLEKNRVFGGPLFYGHAVEGFERPDHPGNVWWHQARLASKLFYALDGKQQEQALIETGSPYDRAASIRLQGKNGDFAGISVSALSNDQKQLFQHALRILLEPYRDSDVEEVMTSLRSNGGLDSLHIAFYKDGDLPDRDGIWDRWKIEGPAFAWFFRGSPHVHTWVNVAHEVKEIA